MPRGSWSICDGPSPRERQSVGPLGPGVPPKGGNPVTPTERGPDLAENDKRNIKVDLRKDLWTSGLLNLDGTIFLPEEVPVSSCVTS
jgi:hypothetical protein